MDSNNIKKIASNIKLVILDVDGVLTNAELFVFENGDYKAFNSRDGLGIYMLIQSGIELAIISGNKSESVEKRFKKFGIKHIYQGVIDKKESYNKIKKDLELDDKQISYMGDDLIDLPVMTKVGLPAAVANADKFVLKYALWVSEFNGGRGAVRELCEFILSAQNKLDKARESFLN